MDIQIEMRCILLKCVTLSRCFHLWFASFYFVRRPVFILFPVRNEGVNLIPGGGAVSSQHFSSRIVLILHFLSGDLALLNSRKLLPEEQERSVVVQKKARVFLDVLEEQRASVKE